MKILGISAYYHDSAIALLEDGKILFACQEERLSRKKHDERFPVNALKMALRETNTKLSELDAIVFYEKPFLKFERLLETYLACAPRGFLSFSKAMPLWVKHKLLQKNSLVKSLNEIEDVPKKELERKLLFAEHHQSHAASAFFPSPFQESAVVTLDGVGEWATTTIAHGNDNKLNMLEEIHYPHSLGLLYSAFTYFLGFKVNSGEYKMMGLAPYGEPRFADTILDNLISLKKDGSFWVNQKYFNYSTGFKMTNKKFSQLFDIEPRKSESEITQIHMDIAASMQAVTERAVLNICEHAYETTKSKNLCLAGGVALNCVANGKVLKNSPFENIWIQPAAGDAGGALGAALAAYYEHYKKPRTPDNKDSMQGALLGPKFSDDTIQETLNARNAKYHTIPKETLSKTAADLIANGNVVGWFQGKMEFGPRALGNRSILGDPRNVDMQTTLNLKIKFRESFRPFAPLVLEEHADEWFDLGAHKSPYMLIVSDLQTDKCLMNKADAKSSEGFDKLKIQRSKIPAVTHVDMSARIQTVHKEKNQKLHELLTAFHKKTDCPVMINTSFNIRGEPIVCTPEDAFRCFMGTGMDVLVMNNFILHKTEQNQADCKRYLEEFELD